MKPRDIERLVRMRSALSEDLRVNDVINHMTSAKMLNEHELKKLNKENRRRAKTLMLLDLLEHKKNDVYDCFLESLSEYHPHLYLQLVDNDDDDDMEDCFNDNQVQDGATAGHENLNLQDEWAVVKQTRQYIMDEVDSDDVLPSLFDKKVLTSEDLDSIRKNPTIPGKTEALLDILETKEQKAYDIFLEVLGEKYPHVFLRLSGSDLDDDDL